jgi:hypothetical protein
MHLAGETDHVAWTRRAEDEFPHKKDREALVAAIERADDAFKKIHPTPSLLSSTPRGILDDLTLAIDRCEVYKAVAGNILFNGSSAPVITSSILAPRFFDKRNRWDGTKWVEDLPFAADWLIQLLTCKRRKRTFEARSGACLLKKRSRYRMRCECYRLARCQIRSIEAGF